MLAVEEYRIAAKTLRDERHAGFHRLAGDAFAGRVDSAVHLLLRQAEAIVDEDRLRRAVVERHHAALHLELLLHDLKDHGQRPRQIGGSRDGLGNPVKHRQHTDPAFASVTVAELSPEILGVEFPGGSFAQRHNGVAPDRETSARGKALQVGGQP